MPPKKPSRPSLTVPSDARPKFEAITALTDAFCREHLNEEYAELCRGLTAALARKRPTPLVRGKEEVWACGIIRTIGWVNFLDDPAQKPHMRLMDINWAFGVAESTAAAKSKSIRTMFRLHRFDPKWTLPSRLGDNPRVWMVEVNGLVVDLRLAPREVQEVAFQKGLIPYIPADREQPVEEQPKKPQNRPDLASFEAEVFGVLFGFYEKVIALLRQSSLDEDKKQVAGERIGLLMQEITDEVKRSRDWHVAGRLESAYEEIRRFIEELSSRGSERPKPPEQHDGE